MAGILIAVDDEWHLEEIPDASFTHELSFVEEVTGEREDLVAGLVAFAGTLPGVARVDRVDREAALLTAPGVPAQRLKAPMRRWWVKATRQRPPWRAAMDRVVRTVEELTAGYGYQRDGLRLTRDLGDGSSHVIAIDHSFGPEPDGHRVSVFAVVVLALSDVPPFNVVEFHGDLNDEAGLVSAITERVLPVLDGLTSVDVMLTSWDAERSIAEDRRQPYNLHERKIHARVLVDRGRLGEARRQYQVVFEHSMPRYREYLLKTIDGLGVPPLDTAADRSLTVGEAAVLAAWPGSRTGRLRELAGPGLDGSPESLDVLWAWLRDARDLLREANARVEPSLAEPYYGALISEIDVGRKPFEPWYRVTVELVTAYVGEVVIGMAPGTGWCIDGEGNLGLTRHSASGLLWRVLAITHEAFGAGEDEFDPHRLRRLADDMVRWVSAPGDRVWNIRAR